jgi:hypothetical protein
LNHVNCWDLFDLFNIIVIQLFLHVKLFMNWI